MRIAVIDLGTNTFNLLVAELSGREFQILHSSKIGVSLGKGGITQNRIAPEALVRAIKALENFQDIWKKLKVDRVIAVGTSAIRDAANQKEFIDVVCSAFDLELEIVTGIEEAQLIYDGISLSVPFHQSSLIMDIGGGSTEFIRIEGEAPIQTISENIGLLRIVQSLSLNDPLSAEDEQQLMNWLNFNSKQIAQLPSCHTLIGAAGSFETFYEMLQQKHFPENQSHATITRLDLDLLLDQLIRSTQDERNKNAYIHPIRKQMIPVAAVKVKWIANLFDIQEVVVSSYSLKEGVLKRFL